MFIRKLLHKIGPKITASQIEGLSKSFLERGLNGGTLELLGRDSNIVLFISKYIDSQQLYGIKLHFVKSAQMQKLIELLEQHLDSRNIIFFDTRVKHINCNVLTIDCNSDTEKVSNLIKVFLLEIAKFPEQRKYGMIARNFSPWDEKITKFDQRQMSFPDGIKKYNDRLREEKGYSVSDILSYVFLGYIQLAGTIGVLYSIVFAEETWQFVNANILNVTIRAPFFGMISVGLMIAGSLRIMTSAYLVRARNSLRGTGQQKVREIGWLEFVQYVFFKPMNFIDLLLVLIVFIVWIE